MSFPSLQVRPNEKNPKVLRAHEFLRQSNQLMERNLLNTDGRKLLAKSLTKMVSEVKAIYALDEKRLESEKCAKLLEKLKIMQESSTSVQEVRFNIAELQRKVLEKKIENQKLVSEIESCRNFVHTTKLEAQREKEKLDERRKVAVEATEMMKARSLSILKHLEDSVEGEKLRKTEEEVLVLEEEVEAMRMEDGRLKVQIRANRATLKAEAKKSFKNTVIECAKHYKLFHTLTPKLQRSQRNVETLKEEEERRRASGSLDDTVLFDRSFVLASLEKEKQRQKEPTVVLPVEPPKITQIIPIPKSPPQPEPIEPEEPIIQAPPLEPIPVEEPVLSSEIDQVTIESEITEESKEEEEEPMEVESSEEHESHENSTINISDLSANASIQEQEHEEAPEAEKSIEKNVSMETQRVVAQPEEPEPIEQEQVDKNQSIDVMEQDEPMEVDAPKGTEKEKRGKPAESFSFNFFRNSPNGESESSGSKSNDFDFGNMFGESGGGDDGSNNGSAFDFLAGGTGNEQDASNSDPFGFGTSSGADGGGDTTFNFNFDGAGEDSGNNNGGNFFNF